MTLQRIVFVIAIGCCMAGAMAGIAEAGDRARQSMLVFSKDVAVPGRVLPAGKYIFRLVDSPSNRHLVQILDQHWRTITTVLTIPATRRADDNGTQVSFGWSRGGTPLRITRWFCPEELEGEEFVYSAQSSKWSE